VAVTFVAARALPENSCFPTSSEEFLALKRTQFVIVSFRTQQTSFQLMGQTAYPNNFSFFAIWTCICEKNDLLNQR
jgi:hypothetical protein